MPPTVRDWLSVPAGTAGARQGALLQGLLAAAQFVGRKLARGGILEIVEVVQHGGAFRRGLEQVAEFAEHVRADDLAVIGDFQDAARPLADIDVEMIAPEIHQHLVQLARGFDGADDFGVLEFRHRKKRPARAFGMDFRLDRPLVPVGEHADGGHVRFRLAGLCSFGLFALALLLHLLLVAEGLVQIGRVHREDVEFGEVGLQLRIVDPFGVQLLLDVPVQAHFFDPLDVAGARAIAESVQDVNDFLSVGERLVVGGRWRDRRQPDDRTRNENRARQMDTATCAHNCWFQHQALGFVAPHSRDRRQEVQEMGQKTAAGVAKQCYSNSSCGPEGRRKAAVESCGPRSGKPARRQATANIFAICSATIPVPVMRVPKSESFSFPPCIARIWASTFSLRSGMCCSNHC